MGLYSIALSLLRIKDIDDLPQQLHTVVACISSIEAISCVICLILQLALYVPNVILNFDRETGNSGSMHHGTGYSYHCLCGRVQFTFSLWHLVVHGYSVQDSITKLCVIEQNAIFDVIHKHYWFVPWISLQSLCPCMDEPICVPAGEEHPLLLETTGVFIEHKEKEVTPFLDNLGDVALSWLSVMWCEVALFVWSQGCSCTGNHQPFCEICIYDLVCESSFTHWFQLC